MYDQRNRIFFSPEKFTGHSFIQIPKCCFFFSREAGKKKYKLIFFYYGKSSSVIHLDFEEIRFFLQNWLCFFFPAFLCGFCVFFFHGKVHMSFIHSILEAGKKNTTRKKKQLFHSFNRNSSKSAQKRTFPGKKNTIPLVSVIEKFQQYVYVK